MKKVIFIAAALIVCTSFSFAVDLESESFDSYSFDPLVNSAFDYAVMPLSATSWDTSDQAALYAIRNALTSSSSINGGNLLYNLIAIKNAVTDDTDSDRLKDIRDALYSTESASDGSIIGSLRDVAYLKTVFLGGSGSFSSPASGSALYYLSYLPNLRSLQSMEYNIDYIEESTDSILDVFSAISEFLQGDAATSVVRPNGNSWTFQGNWRNNLLNADLQLGFDMFSNRTQDRTLYGRIKQLQETLASDDDMALAEAQKQNREEIEDSFLNGSSGSTSLGAGDFQNLNSVGSEVTDLFSLGGQASIDVFVSGFGDAESAGSGWFSAATQSQLDTVPVTFSLGDPYNMAGWESNYEWVLGGDFE